MGQHFSDTELHLIAWLRKLAKPERFDIALKMLVDAKRNFNIEVVPETVEKLVLQCS